MHRHPRIWRIFGVKVAVRIGSSISFNVELEATKVIHGILTVASACRTCQSDPTTWATDVMNFLTTDFQSEARTNELKPLTNLASEMLSHLLIASMGRPRLLVVYRARSRNPDKTVKNCRLQNTFLI
jgi:hypothetical protein